MDAFACSKAGLLGYERGTSGGTARPIAQEDPQVLSIRGTSGMSSCISSRIREPLRRYAYCDVSPAHFRSR
jgi:hypothetical protein